MPTRTSLVLYNLPTSTIQGTKSLPSVQPSSTTRVPMITETLQPTPQSSRAPSPRNSESIQLTFRSHSTASVHTLHTESSRPTASAGSPFLILNFKTIAIIAGAATFVVATTCIVIAILAVIIACRCSKSRKRHVKREDSTLGRNAAYDTTVHSSAALRTYRPGDTYDYPRFGHQLLKSVNKGRGTDLEVLNGAVVRPDNAYASVTTFSTARKNEAAHISSPISSEEDFEDNMQTNEAYVATPTSTSDFAPSAMQINEAYVATPTSANESFEQSTQQTDDEIYENYSNELDEYSYVRHVHH